MVDPRKVSKSDSERYIYKIGDYKISIQHIHDVIDYLTAITIVAVLYALLAGFS